MLPIDRRHQYAALGLIFLAIMVGALWDRGEGSSEDPIKFEPTNMAPQKLVPNPLDSGAVPEPNVVVVHVAGAVGKPGLYEFAPGTRVHEALKQAASTANADLEQLNLAAKLADGDQLYVPRKTETAPESKVNPLYQGGPSAPSKYVQSTRPAGGNKPALAPLGPGSISLNTASLAELDRLPGVGPTTAEKILAYRRDHGGFASIDEMLSVKGIGPKKLAAMRKYLRL